MRAPRISRRKRAESSHRRMGRPAAASVLGVLELDALAMAEVLMAMRLHHTSVLVANLDGPWLGVATPDQMGPATQIGEELLERAIQRDGVGVLVVGVDDCLTVLLTRPTTARAA